MTGKDSSNYFAYGSNMCSRRLQERVPSARVIGVGSVSQHRLEWHKLSRDKSGKCDLFFTGCEADIVYGVLYSISISEKAELDLFEGLGNGYKEKQVKVELFQSCKYVEASTYYATNIKMGITPYTWYKRYVVEGAKEHGLPKEYIAALEAVHAEEDTDRERHEKESHIFNCS